VNQSLQWVSYIYLWFLSRSQLRPHLLAKVKLSQSSPTLGFPSPAVSGSGLPSPKKVLRYNSLYTQCNSNPFNPRVSLLLKSQNRCLLMIVPSCLNLKEVFRNVGFLYQWEIDLSKQSNQPRESFHHLEMLKQSPFENRSRLLLSTSLSLFKIKKFFQVTQLRYLSASSHRVQVHLHKSLSWNNHYITTGGSLIASSSLDGIVR